MKLFITTIFAFLLSLQMQAQQGKPPGGPNIQALKIGYFTKYLELSVDDTQKFWPLYFNMQDELKAARQANKDDVLPTEEAVVNIKKKYLVEFKKALGDKRGSKVFVVEKDFTLMLRDEMMKRNQQKNNNR